MRYLLIVFLMLLGSMTSAMAQLSVGIGLPGVSIGINLPVYPELVRVPGYPVYYAPRLNSNFFFYDGMYWVYQDDNWYASSWYNGPWGLVAPAYVPLFVLRIPVRYYRAPPVYFRDWRADAPPRWGEHWGHEWQQQRGGWDKWNRSSAPAPAPLPTYQRRYSGDRYPPVEQQRSLRGQNYRYQPRDTVARQHYQEQAVPTAPAPGQRTPQGRPAAPRAQPPQMRSEQAPRAAPTQVPPQMRNEQAPRVAPTQAPPRQSGAPGQDQRRQPPQGREKKRLPDEERGQDRN